MEKSYLVELFEQNVSSVWKEHSPAELYSVTDRQAAKFKRLTYGREAEQGKVFLEAVMLHGMLAVADRLKSKLGSKFFASVQADYGKLLVKLRGHASMDELRTIVKHQGSIAAKVSEVLLKRGTLQLSDDRVTMFTIGGIAKFLEQYLLPAPTAWRIRGGLTSRVEKGGSIQHQALKLYVSFAAQAAHALGELLALVMFIKKHNVNRQTLEKDSAYYNRLKMELTKAYRSATMVLPTLARMDPLKLLPNVKPITPQRAA